MIYHQASPNFYVSLFDPLDQPAVPALFNYCNLVSGELGQFDGVLIREAQAARRAWTLPDGNPPLIARQDPPFKKRRMPVTSML